jgi:hypothetical protein
MAIDINHQTSNTIGSRSFPDIRNHNLYLSRLTERNIQNSEVREENRLEVSGRRWRGDLRGTTEEKDGKGENRNRPFKHE